MSIKISINNIRNIKQADIELPFDKGMYALVGTNGCGKSTLMLLLSLVIKTSSAHLITEKDTSNDSRIEITDGIKSDVWIRNTARKMTTTKYDKTRRMYASVHYHGFYEGSIFYGSRFDDYNKITDFFSKANFENDIVDADPFVSQTLGYILHNDKEHYNNLKRIRSRNVAKEAGFKGFPYFYMVGENIISQYQMSSGESMLISLIDFINNLVRKGNYKKLFFLIDEVELALHPAAIDRLQRFLNDLIEKSETELVVYFSTHSSELIQRIPAKNIYLLENDNGAVNLTNPCYPNYAVRNLYIPNGFDFLLLVEDDLTKAIVERVINENNLSTSKLCCVLPAGGCTQMLKLHHDMITYNTLGLGKHIISVFDGDVKDEICKKAEYSSLPKCFLPIPSVEKYLKRKMIDASDKAFIKLIGDKYFNQRSLNDIIFDYKNDPRTANSKDNDGKIFYKVICSNLEKIGMKEEIFIQYISKDIYEYENPVSFVTSLKKLLA